MKTIVLFIAITSVLMSCKQEQVEGLNDKLEVATNAEKTVGVGRLQVSLNQAIPLYRTAQDTLPFDFLLFYQNQSGPEKRSFVMVRASLGKVNPLHFYRGNTDEEAKMNLNSGLVYFASQLVFRMTALSNDSFEIVLNEETFEKAVVKQDRYHILYTGGKAYWQMRHDSSSDDSPWFLCEKWDSYLKRIFYVYYDKPTIYDAPNGQPIYSSIRYGYLRVEEVDGEWAKVKKYSVYWEEDKQFPSQGWIRWTDGEKFLVNPVEEVYY